MISNFNSIVSIIKNAYRNNHSHLCLKNFPKSEIILVALRNEGFIRGFSIINKKTLKIFLSYTKNKTPSLTAASPLTSIRKRNLIGCFNINRILRDFNVIYATGTTRKLDSIKSRKKEYERVSQGIFLIK